MKVTKKIIAVFITAAMLLTQMQVALAADISSRESLMAGETEPNTNLTPGETYYFDLSKKTMKNNNIEIPSTVNPALPDTSLKWVPFTYVGNINAYARKSAGASGTSEDNSAFPHTLFIANDNVTIDVAWDDLSYRYLVFYENGFTKDGGTYHLRLPSVGSNINNQTGADFRCTPLTNEWDQILDKNMSFIPNINGTASWGQDSNLANSGERYVRGYPTNPPGSGARGVWPCGIGFRGNTAISVGYRPVLQPTFKGAAKTVTFDMGGNGTLGDGSMTSAKVVYTQNAGLTLPKISEENGFKYTGPDGTGDLAWFSDDSTYYRFGTKVNLPSGTTLMVKRITSPNMVGPETMTLHEGYSAVSTDAYSITGNPPPTKVEKISGIDKITWNNGTKRLDIAEGLGPGTYPIRLMASSPITPNKWLTFTLTVTGKTVSQVLIKTPLARTTYEWKDIIYLSGLVVTLVKSDGSTEDVSFADFKYKGLTTSPGNSIMLEDSTLTKVTITHTLSTKTVEQPITVKPKPAQPVIITESLPKGTVGEAYYAKLEVSESGPDRQWLVAGGGGLPPGLSLNSITGEITGKPTANGEFQFLLRINTRGGTTQKFLNISVNLPPLPPTAPTAKVPVPTQSMVAGSYTKFIAADIAEDEDGDTLTVTGIATEPDSTYATASLYSGTVTIVGKGAGSTFVVVIVSDGTGKTVDVTVPIVVTAAPINHAPSAKNPVPTQNIPAGSNASFTAADIAEDTDGDALTIISIVTAPSAIATASLNSGTITVTRLAEGSTSMVVTVSDGKGETVDVTVPIFAPINHAPIAKSTVPTQSMIAGGYTKFIAADVAEDEDGDTLTVIGIATEPDSLTAKAYLYSGTVTITGKAAGSTSVVLIVSDGKGETGVVTVPIVIAPDPNHAPTAKIPVPTLSVVVGSDISFNASDIAEDEDGDTLTIVDIYDYTSHLYYATRSGSTVNFKTRAVGSATAEVVVSDGKLEVHVIVPIEVTATAPSNHTPTAKSAVPTQSMTVGSNASFTAADIAEDEDSDALTVTDIVTVPDSTYATASITSGAVMVTGEAAGTTYVTVTVSDGNSGTVDVTVPITVLNKIINIASIDGVTAPVRGETPITLITETAQYTGTVTWSPDDSTFAASTTYTATVTLTPKAGYTLTGVAADLFTVSGATSVSNDINSGVITAVFPATEAEPDTAINIASIGGVTAPVRGATPVTSITETAQYTGTITWSPDDSTFAASTTYTATVTLTPKAGYTLTGVAADLFTVSGATSVSNDINSGVITAVFPATEAEPDTAINIASIGGVTAPVRGATPVTSITETAQYTGTITWSPGDSTFAASTTYTATVTLTPKAGYTLTGVAADFFTVSGATSESNDINSGVITAVFPSTETEPAVPVTIISVTVKTEPTKTTYTAGDILNLDGLVVTLHKSNSTTEDVAFADFGTNGITTTPTNGTGLSISDTSVTITYTADNKSVSQSITVNPAPVVNSATISPTGINYDLNAPADVVTTITWNSASKVTDVVCVTTSLTTPDAYVVTGSALTIKSSYINTLGISEGDVVTFKISFDKGNLVTFTINIVNSYTPAANAKLNNLTVNGSLVSGFDPNTTIYNVELPYGTTSVLVGAVPDDAHAAVDITQAQVLPGDATVVVTAEDKITTKSYTIHFAMGAAPTAYQVAVNGSYATASGAGSYYSGDIVIVNAGSRNNYTFSGWTSTDGVTFANANSAITTFTMAAGNVTVTASWNYSGGSGGSSDGGGNVGGSSSTKDDSDSIEVKQETKPNQPTIGSISVKAKKGADNSASAKISEKTVANAIVKAQAAATEQKKTENGIGVSLSVSSPARTKSLGIILTQPVLTQLLKAEVSSFEIDGVLGTLNFDLKAIKEIQKQSTGDVTINITPVTGLNGDAKTLIGSRPVYNISISYVKDGKTMNITSLNNGSVILSISYTPGQNEATAYLFGVYVDGNGNATRIPNSIYDANSGGIIFDSNHFSMYGVGYIVPSTKFTDISTHWARESIDYVVGRGLLAGTSETTFSPDTSMSRGMLVTTLGRMDDADVSSYKTSSFTDVKADSTFLPYIEWAYKKGIISGIGNQQFAPDRAVTREEISAILKNYAKAIGYTLPITRKEGTFADSSSISSCFKDAVKAMQQTGIMSGKNNGYFEPKCSVTRAEVSTMLHRYIKLTIDPATAQGW